MEVKTKDMNLKLGHDEGACILPEGAKKAFGFLVEIKGCTDEVMNG